MINVGTYVRLKKEYDGGARPYGIVSNIEPDGMYTIYWFDMKQRIKDTRKSILRCTEIIKPIKQSYIV